MAESKQHITYGTNMAKPEYLSAGHYLRNIAEDS